MSEWGFYWRMLRDATTEEENVTWYINVEWAHPKGAKETVDDANTEEEANRLLHSYRRSYTPESVRRMWKSRRKVQTDPRL